MSVACKEGRCRLIVWKGVEFHISSVNGVALNGAYSFTRGDCLYRLLPLSSHVVLLLLSFTSNFQLAIIKFTTIKFILIWLVIF